MKEISASKNEHKKPYKLIPAVLMIVVIAEIVVFVLSGLSETLLSLPVLQAIVRIAIVIVGMAVLLKMRRQTQSAEGEEADEEEKNTEDIDAFQQSPTIDELTRTANERGLTISVLELMALADRYGHKLSIGMVRIDGIEQLERSAAENAIINAAGIMTESLRLPDRIGRFKENIFMLLLPESDIDGASIVANRLKSNLAGGASGDYLDQVSVQIGMTQFKRGEDLHSLLSRVESAVDEANKTESGISIKQA
jgi:diguanylate cyclase (GGDEF)-like protein